jgi:hypothetical protein
VKLRENAGTRAELLKRVSALDSVGRVEHELSEELSSEVVDEEVLNGGREVLQVHLEEEVGGLIHAPVMRGDERTRTSAEVSTVIESENLRESRPLRPWGWRKVEVQGGDTQHRRQMQLRRPERKRGLGLRRSIGGSGNFAEIREITEQRKQTTFALRDEPMHDTFSVAAPEEILGRRRSWGDVGGPGSAPSSLLEGAKTSSETSESRGVFFVVVCRVADHDGTALSEERHGDEGEALLEGDG